MSLNAFQRFLLLPIRRLKREHNKNLRNELADLNKNGKIYKIKNGKTVWKNS